MPVPRNPESLRRIRGREYLRWAGVAVLFWGLTSVAPPSRARASPPDLFGYGPRTSGLAMTGVAYASGYEATFANPAGLARTTQRGLAIGFQAGSFELRLDGEPFPQEPATGTVIGLHLPVPFGGVLEGVFTLGAGFYTPLDVTLRNDVLFTEEAQWTVLGRSHAVTIQVGLGIDLGRWASGLRVGVGVSALADTRGRLLVQLDEADRFVSLTETQLVAGFNPLVGMSYDLDLGKGRRLQLGVVYRRVVKAEIGLDITVENLPVELPLITISALAQYDPHTVAAEGALFLDAHWMLVLHATYRRWSAYPGNVRPTSSHSNLPPDPDFRDTVSPRIAVEYTAARDRTTGRLRAGYFYEPTPAPPARIAQRRDFEGQPLVVRGEPQRAPMRLLDSDRHGFTLGAAVTWRSPRTAVLSLDVFGQLQRVTERRHRIPREGRDAPMITSGYLLVGGWTAGLDW